MNSKAVAVVKGALVIPAGGNNEGNFRSVMTVDAHRLEIMTSKMFVSKGAGTGWL